MCKQHWLAFELGAHGMASATVGETMLEQAATAPDGEAFETKGDYDVSQMSHEAVHSLDVARDFCREASEVFRQEFWWQVDHNDGLSAFSERIWEFIRSRRMDTPRFRLLLGDARAEFLRKHGLKVPENLEDLPIVVFQLPKPLALWWWKGEGSWGAAAEPMPPGIVQWGRLYRETVPTIWEGCRFYEDEDDIVFVRLNDVGEHDPMSFYYVWAIGWPTEDEED